MEKFVYNLNLSIEENWKRWIGFRFQEILMRVDPYWEQEIEFVGQDEITHLIPLSEANLIMRSIYFT